MNLPDPGATGLLPIVHIGGVALHAVSERDTVRHILNELKHCRGGWVSTPNLDHMRRMHRDPAFRALVAQADLVVADGMPLVWASRLRGTPLPERVAGSHLISSLTQGAAMEGFSIFLLGGAPGTAERAAEVLSSKYTGLRIAGCLCPEIRGNCAADQLEAMSSYLAASRADIVYVALGAPKQERLIHDLRPCLPRAWWLGVGISFSFLCGHVRQAPGWMQGMGLEWLHRLIQEPRRLARRYLLEDLPFGVCLLTRSLFLRFPTREKPARAASDSRSSLS